MAMLKLTEYALSLLMKISLTVNATIKLLYKSRINSLTVEFMIESHKVCLEWKVKVVLADTSFKIKYNEKCE